MTSLEVQLIRLQILSQPSHCPPGISNKRGGESCNDGLDDVVLYREHVGHLAVVALRPDVEAIADVGELRRHAQPISGAPDAAFKHSGYVEFAADLVDVGVPTAEVERRGPRRYAQSRQPCERVDEIFGEPSLKY